MLCRKESAQLCIHVKGETLRICPKVKVRKAKCLMSVNLQSAPLGAEGEVQGRNEAMATFDNYI